MSATETSRCPWVGADPQMIAYHDEEWGVPQRDDRQLWGKLVLDGFQAGLSWAIVLRKRDGFLRVFEGFDPERVALWDDARVAAALADPGIVRNGAKVRAAVTNAQAWVRLRDQGRSFSELLWSFTGGEPVVNTWRTLGELPARTPASEAMSKELERLGFRFCGPTICYAFMQAVGMVNDHVVGCHRHAELGG